MSKGLTEAAQEKKCNLININIIHQSTKDGIDLGRIWAWAGRGPEQAKDLDWSKTWTGARLGLGQDLDWGRSWT